MAKAMNPQYHRQEKDQDRGHWLGGMVGWKETMGEAHVHQLPVKVVGFGGSTSVALAVAPASSFQ